MKKLAIIIITISLLIIAFFQYKKYGWLVSVKEYEYIIPSEIDVNYYDEVLLQQYYENAYKLESLVRSEWKNNKINVLNPDEDKESKELSDYFNKMIAINKRIEGKLTYSTELKTKGYSNKSIKEIIENGLSLDEYEASNHTALTIEYGDINHEVWELQKALIALGYEIPKDGHFGIETQNALKNFQAKHDLFPSGLMDVKTLELILKKD